MPMKLSTKVIKVLLINVFMAFALSVVATALGLISAGFSGETFWRAYLPAVGLNFLLAYVISFFVGMFIPSEAWGFAFAQSRGVKPTDGLKFGMLINVVVNTVFTLVNALILTYVNAILLQGAPLSSYLGALIGCFIPCWVVGFLVSLPWAPKAEKIARSITKDC